MLVTCRGGNYDTGTVNEGRDHATPVLELILGEEMRMAVTVITTSLTLASSVPALAEQARRSESEYAHALRLAHHLGEQLGSSATMFRQ